jgi:hypothetical protein
MKCLLSDEKLIFRFTHFYVRCYNYDYGYYQTNGILSFAVKDLVFKIMKQQKRKSIVLKKRKPILHLLNYVDTLSFNSNRFDIILPIKNDFKTPLIHNLYLHRNSYQRRYYEDLYKDNLKVIERENLCIIRLEYDYSTEIQPKNLNLVTMLMRVIQKEEIDMVHADGIIFYCVFLM